MKNLYFRFGLLVIPLLFLFQNCGVKAPGVDANLASAGYVHTGNETSCAGCHEGIRPASTANFIGLNINAPFDYTLHARGVDCISCHSLGSTGARTKAEWAQPYYVHNSTLATCANCHNSQRPDLNAPPSITVGPNAFTAVAFNHAASGTADCVGCHQASFNTPFANYTTSNTTTWGDTDWKGGVSIPQGPANYANSDFSLTIYEPTYTGETVAFAASSTITTIMNMNHTTTQLTSAQLQDCTMCHAGANAGHYQPGYFHESLFANNINQPAACIDCHTLNDTPRFASSFVGPLSNFKNPLSPDMRHGAVTWSKNASNIYVQGTIGLVANDCVVCHKAPTQTQTPGDSWNIPPVAVATDTTAHYHASLAVGGFGPPSSCIDCHANDLPNPAAPKPTTALPTTVMRFDHTWSARWGSADCNICHTPPTTLAATAPTLTTPWTGGIFHQAQINSTLTQCNSCHDVTGRSQRPTTTSLTTPNGVVNNFTAYNVAVLPFDLNTHGNTMDCISCHTATMSTNYSTVAKFAGGNYDHAAAKAAGTMPACISCHLSQRPTTPVGPNSYYLSGAFDHATTGQSDCGGCHNATVVAGKYTNYKTANTTTWGDTDWKGGLGMDLNQPMGPDTALPKTTLSPAPQHLSTNSPPMKLITVTTPSPAEQIYDQMLHSSSQVQLAIAGIGTITTTPSAQCNACHKSYNSGSGAITPVTFHAATGINNANLTNCKDCHTATAPINIVGANQTTDPMNHFAILSNTLTPIATVDCIACHTNTGAGTSFGTPVAKFHANLPLGVMPNNCTACHFTTLLAGTGNPITNYSAANLYTTGMKHMSAFATGECLSCHGFTTNAQIAATVTGSGASQTSWGNGANPGFAFFHKNIAPSTITSCSECHTTKPTALTLSAVDAQHMSHSSASVAAGTVVPDCVTCHKNDLTAGASPAAATTSWKNTNLFHAYVTATTCKDCHGLTNGGGAVEGTNNDIPAAATNSQTLTASKVSGFAGVFAKIDHREADVKNLECNQCHTTQGTTANAAAKWFSAKFHTKFNANSLITGDCITCHASENPNNAAPVTDSAGNTVPTHNTVVSCKGCHLLPGKGTAASPDWYGAVGTGHSPPYTAKCTTCHGTGGAAQYMPGTTTPVLPPTTKWYRIPGTDNKGNTISALSGSTSAPSGTGGKGGFNHDPTYMAGQDCIACHMLFANAATTVGVTWTYTGFYSHSGFGATTSCLPCHGTGHNGNHGTCDSSLAAGTTGTNGNTTTKACAGTTPNGSGDNNIPYQQCIGCHEHQGSTNNPLVMPTPAGTPTGSFGGDMPGDGGIGC